MIISRDDLCPCVSCLPLHRPTSPCASGRRKPECSHPIQTLPQSDSSTCTNQLLVNFVNFSRTLEDKGKGGESRFQSESNLQEENECTVIVILKFAACMTLTQCTAVCSVWRGHIPTLQPTVSCLKSLESKHAAPVCFGQSGSICMQIG